MVVKAKRSIHMGMSKSSTLRLMYQDFKAAFKLDPIDAKESNYVGPLIVHSIFSICWGLFVFIFTQLVKTVSFKLGLTLPIFIIPINGFISIIIYGLFFKKNYTNSTYFSIEMYSSVYIWPLLITESVLISLCQAESIFIFVHFIVFNGVRFFFLQTQFADSLRSSSPKKRLVFHLVELANSIIVGSLLLHFSFLSPIFS